MNSNNERERPGDTGIYDKGIQYLQPPQFIDERRIPPGEVSSLHDLINKNVDVFLFGTDKSQTRMHYAQTLQTKGDVTVFSLDTHFQQPTEPELDGHDKDVTAVRKLRQGAGVGIWFRTNGVGNVAMIEALSVALDRRFNGNAIFVDEIQEANSFLNLDTANTGISDLSEVLPQIGKGSSATIAFRKNNLSEVGVNALLVPILSGMGYSVNISFEDMLPTNKEDGYLELPRLKTEHEISFDAMDKDANPELYGKLKKAQGFLSDTPWAALLHGLDSGSVKYVQWGEDMSDLNKTLKPAIDALSQSTHKNAAGITKLLKSLIESEHLLSDT